MSGTSKPRRPPDYPRFAGLVWRRATSGRARSGDPYAQWAYVCPSDPDGLERSHLPFQPLDVQTEVVWTWFRANFEPFQEGEGWPGYGTSRGGYGIAMGYVPEHHPAGVILEEEFSGVAAPAVLAEATALFAGMAANWILKPPSTPVEGTPDVAIVRAALARLKEAAEVPPPAGHNQGPPLVDQVPVAEIVEGVRQGEIALAASEVEGKRSPTVVAAVKLGQDMLGGAMRQVGQELAKLGMPEAGHWLSVLYRYLVDALTALVQWSSGG